MTFHCYTAVTVHMLKGQLFCILTLLSQAELWNSHCFRPPPHLLTIFTFSCNADFLKCIYLSTLPPKLTSFLIFFDKFCKIEFNLPIYI